jgi:hypothetical protein
MAKPKPAQHNSKPMEKNYLHPLQRKIILHLANNNPKTINQIVKEIKSHYKSTWNALKTLEENKLVQKVTIKKYKGQEYPQYWLSDNGTFIALNEGAKAETVIKKTHEIYPDNKNLHYFIESISILGSEAFNVGYHAIIKKGKLEDEDFREMVGIQVKNGISPEQLSRFSKVLKEYPEQIEPYSDFIKDINKQIDTLSVVAKKSPKKSIFDIFKVKKNKI